MSYVRFYSSSSFTLGTNGNAKKWNGTDSNAMEYSLNASTWTAWAGTSAITASLDSVTNTYNIYLRGTGNTKLTTATSDSTEVLTYVFTGDGLIDCEGTIEALFDYTTVDNNQHPTMANYACVSIFYNQTMLRTPPELSSPNLSNGCYARMFMGCTALAQAPALPATTLATFCYSNMFKNCSSLVNASILPATTMVASCYRGMFSNCTSLVSPPILPATTLQPYCYYYMFENCTSLLIAPDLPALTLYSYCYQNMFSGCSALTIPPALPATTLAAMCYNSMFYDSGIKLSTTQHDDYTLAYRIPSEGTGTTASNALTNMFYDSGVDTPVINTTYYVKDTKYATYKSELTSIANAIRIKGGTSSILDYPEDFITVINNIPSEATLQAKTNIIPTTSSQTITPDSGYDGLSSVQINGDTDLIASNIKKDVTIFGVTGTYEGGGMTIVTTQDSHGGDILTITGELSSSYSLITSQEYAISNFTTTSATSHATINLGSSYYTSNKIIYVKVRDKAGPRNGYFVGCDAYYFNYYAANNSTTTLAVRPIVIHRCSSSGAFTSYATGSNTGYGVYPNSITSAGALGIYKRYSSTYSLTIDGTYVVEVYALDFAPTAGNPFSYSYPTS